MKFLPLIVLVLSVGLWLMPVAAVYSQGEVDPLMNVSPIATTGGELELDYPVTEMIAVPDVVSPLTVCQQQQYWGISYALLGGLILYGLFLYRPSSRGQGLLAIGGVGTGLVFINSIIGCACASSLWCGRFGLIVLISALSLAWYTLSFKQRHLA